MPPLGELYVQAYRGRAMDNLSLLEFSLQLRQQQPQRSFSFNWQGQKLWLKQQEPALPAWRRVLPKLIASLSSNPLYFPSIEPVAALAGEAKRLQLLGSLGFNVPRVLVASEEYLVLSDVGPSLKYWLTEAQPDTEQRREILLQAAAALAGLHQHNRWHGRPALRDLCWDGKQISFIDFEENPHQQLSIDQCMVRDVLIFIHGLYRYLEHTDPLIEEVITEYRRLAPGRVWRDSLAVVDQMWLVYPLLELSHGLLGKDGKQALLALRQLRQHRSGQQRSKLPWIVLSLLLAYALANQFD